MPLPTSGGKKAASPASNMSSGSPALRERLRKLQATGKKARQKTKPSKKTGPPQFSPVLPAKARAGAGASTSADAHHKEAASGLRRPGPGHAGLDAAELAGPRAGAVGARNTKQVVVARQHRGPAGRG